MLLGRFGLFALLVAAWLTGIASGAPAEAPNVTVITVTAGKPTELAFKLSKLSNLTPGPISFRVTNVGAVEHAFKICTAPTTSANANSCVGRATKPLKGGRSQTINVVLKKPGRYEFLCPLPGPRRRGHEGTARRRRQGLGLVGHALSAPSCSA